MGGYNRIASAKFLRAVRPGEALTLRHETDDRGMVRFEITAGAHKVAVGSLARTAS